MAAIVGAHRATAGGGRVRRQLPSRPPPLTLSVPTWAAAGPGPVFEPRVGRPHPGAREEEHSDAARRRTSAGRTALPRPCGDLSVGETELEETGGAPLCRSRFLKVRSEKVQGSQWYQTSGNAGQTVSRQVPKSSLGSAAHPRLSSALTKVAQLESKIMNRKKQLELQNAALDQKPLDEESFSSASSHEHSARGKKYLKNYAAASGNRSRGNACSKEEESIQNTNKKVMVKQQLVLDSDEEEMRELMDRSLEFSSRSEDRRVTVSDSKWGGKSKTPISSGEPPPSHKASSPIEVSKASSFLTKDSEKNVFSRVTSGPSPASRNLSVGHNTRSPSLSSMRDNTVKMALPRTGDANKQSQISLESDRSDIKSLDELFSKAADAEDSSSSSSNDFRLNILSLDDLAPDIPSEAAELKQTGTDVHITQESNRNPKPDTFLAEKDQTSLKMSTVTDVNDVSEGDTEKTVSEAEISEHLSEVSADFSSHKQDYLDHDEPTVNSEYSEDFESSQSATDGESVSKMSEECSESCAASGKHPPSAPAPSLARERRDQVHRVTVREAAVQTADPLFTYCWPKTTASAVLDAPVGHSYVEPVPIASHVISMDAVEALSAYSPSVLVLHAMLKQHLMLTQQFVENVHHLHFSLVESLESEKFHYHTLEEAKEYIKNHRSRPLTIKQAREEIESAGGKTALTL